MIIGSLVRANQVRVQQAIAVGLLLLGATPSYGVAAQTESALWLPTVLSHAIPGPQRFVGQLVDVQTLATALDLVLLERNVYVESPPASAFDPWLSRDGGLHWQQPAVRPWAAESTSVFGGWVQHALVDSPAGPLLAAGRVVTSGVGEIESVLYTSDDFGETWSRRVLPDVAGCATLLLVQLHTTPAQPNQLYVESTCGDLNGTPQARNTWLSTADAGLTWEIVVAPERSGVFTLLSPVLAGRVFVVDRSLGLNRSDDQGITWNRVGAVPNGLFQLSRHSPDRILAQSQWGPFVSADSGATWAGFSPLPCVLNSDWFLAEIARPLPQVVVHCEDGRLAATPDDGVSWADLAAPPWPASSDLVAYPDQAVPGRLWVQALSPQMRGLWRLDPGQAWVAVVYIDLPSQL